MLACELDRMETGDSAVGEKYDWRARSSGVAGLEMFVAIVNGGGPFATWTWSGMWNLGGATLDGSCVAKDELPLAVDLDRRLVLEAFRLIV